ncbi:YetF domain-containing protein [Metabacillus malikii]|uniref:Uncharacterized membrane protein YcaP (DUF421 family) n=1 Tax=Metabacillus malikii TaxID=1504265 RepID=A0ABT9ZFF5_9BACI|nr:DUF421 domain-containing protein [Metabacillus malikii]MDQ0229985.1 uncharacterized membrane protein YcaP (DUF421 family) [Metabacillus malikii]
MFLQILVEIIGGYFVLLILVKCLGKTQISQITPFDFISALVVGEFVGSAIFDDKIGLPKIIFAIAIWGLLIFLTEFITQKSRKFRYLFEGRPSMIINDGKLDWRELKKNQLDVDQLQQLLRSKDVFSLKEVKYAILETNGSISVIRQFEADKPTTSDLNLKNGTRHLPITLISDGEILEINLKKAGVDKDWLLHQLNSEGISNSKDVCYAEWSPSHPLFIQTY